MSDSRLIFEIRNNPHLLKLWNRLTADQKRQALEMARDEPALIDYILEDLSEENQCQTQTI